MTEDVLLACPDLSIPRLYRGKVRELFDLGDRLLMVASDRLSAFDVVFPEGIPEKGRVLTQLSALWFQATRAIAANHYITMDLQGIGLAAAEEELLAGRAMVVQKIRRIDVECVVRGYLAGSGWKEYRKDGTVCGIQLAPGLVESSQLPEPIFTPASKEQSGHDINISFEAAAEKAGVELASRLRDLTLDIYKKAAEYALTRGIIIADTKFEFGFIDGVLTLGDEVLTPDSSRFWPAAEYKPGGAQPSFDKQYVRDYLETLDWNKQPPAPVLPDDVVAGTRAKYLDAYTRLTGMTCELVRHRLARSAGPLRRRGRIEGILAAGNWPDRAAARDPAGRVVLWDGGVVSAALCQQAGHRETARLPDGLCRNADPRRHRGLGALQGDEGGRPRVAGPHPGRRFRRGESNPNRGGSGDGDDGIPAQTLPDSIAGSRIAPYLIDASHVITYLAPRDLRDSFVETYQRLRDFWIQHDPRTGKKLPSADA